MLVIFENKAHVLTFAAVLSHSVSFSDVGDSLNLPLIQWLLIKLLKPNQLQKLPFR